MKKVSIVIPAHNEEKRIGKTLQMYHRYFKELYDSNTVDFEFVVVLNGCTDNTVVIMQELQKRLSNIIVIDVPQAGKGLAIQIGFVDALTRANDWIGFVDADMATEPKSFYALIEKIGDYNGIIASRYMPGAQVFPPRPWIKRQGSRAIYEPTSWLLFGLNYHDLQCGAKLFTRSVIQTITAHLTERQWAFDIELLYLCKKFGFKIKEIPTIWHDQTDSKFKILRSGLPMFGSLFALRWRHLWKG